FVQRHPNRARDPCGAKPAFEFQWLCSINENAVLGKSDSARGATGNFDFPGDIAADFRFTIQQVTRAVDRAARVPRFFLEIGLFNEGEFVWRKAFKASVA